MKLQDYMKRENLTQHDLGESIGVTGGAVGHWFQGRRPIPPRRAIQIERLTNGEVTIDEMVYIEAVVNTN